MATERILINGVTQILKKLVPVVVQEIGSAWGVKDELDKLQRTLEMILVVIADAERKQVRDEAVRLWLRRLKDVAYDADDVMDEFSYQAMRLLKRDSLRYKVHDFVSSSNPLSFRYKLASQIKGINSKLKEIIRDMDMFQLKTIPSSTTVACEESRERQCRQTTSFASMEQIVGRENDKDKLVRMLTTVTASTSTSPSNHLEKVPHVASIVGMGGLGKTTLAQLVYNDDSVKKHFDPKIWVCVSEYFNVHRLLSDIMESITLEKFSGFSNFDVLVFKVRQQLTGKRYLLVLDDLWNEDADQWEKLLQSSLIVGAQGSKILTTTRKRQVADIVKGSISPYFLEKLQADECWSIMEGKAFSPGGALKTPNMISIGKEIADKCGGLPLAAKFLGSLMHSKNKERNWLSIRENDMWNTPECKIIPILKLSYDNLSPHLQRCFSYCSIFPKDWELSKQTLIQLWMAEGFLQPSNVGTNCSFEDIGDEYFESLMWSSFFDGVEKNELDDVTTFKMHDLVHDLAQVVVGDHECSTVKGPDQLEKLSEVRRLNLIMDKELSATFHKTMSKLKKLRTVIVLEPNYYLNLCRFSSNNHLRILHLGRPAKDCSGMRYTTSKLRRLRYFHISSMHLNSNLLDDYSFSRLYNLQTLVLSGCALVQNRIKEMGSLNHLRHLDISFSDIKELPDSVTSLRNLQRLDLNHCKNFTTFPDSVIGLEFLRFLDMSFTPIEKIPDFVTSLRHLQTLDINTCKILKTLPEYVAGLNNLSIFNFKNCPLLEVLPEDFGELYQLRSLDLEGTQILL
ncbi:putative disease resistance protein RGA4 [Papaver somniferum]|uniref:putative disease resistance protein RGA4 n=1 Tax=Papaver somniferum TaxID=3469 RepID=UPI000E6F68AA|nr:putative disease resistance protein RGA4 [Papaver somniferum]